MTGSLAHLIAAVRIAVAAAAKDNYQTVRIIITQRREKAPGADTIVRVIHNDGAMIAGVYQLHTSVHLDGSQRTVDGI